MTAQETWTPSPNIADWKSNEEFYFYHWCLEAWDKGIIDKFVYNQEYDLTVELMPKVEIDCINKNGKKNILRSLLNNMEYTPDFRIFSNNDKIFLDIENSPNEKYWKLLKSQEGICHIDTKGCFIGKHNNSAVTFPLLQKIIWEKTGIYVNKLIPEKFFLTTFAPNVFFYSQTGELRYHKDKKDKGKKIYYDSIYLNIEQYLKSL